MLLTKTANYYRKQRPSGPFGRTRGYERAEMPVVTNGCQSTIGLSARKPLVQVATPVALRSYSILETLNFPFGFVGYHSELKVLLDLNRGGRKRLAQDSRPISQEEALWPLVLVSSSQFHEARPQE
jgi:hypothetical protein